jgi:hypothetical protein
MTKVRHHRRVSALLGGCLLLCGAPLRADAQDPDDEPPVAGQPVHFGGAVGKYRIRAEAEPTHLQAEDALTLTVTITGSGPPRHPPRRPDLRRLPEFARSFVIDDLAGPPPSAGVWIFRYRLKPRSARVKEIPALRFDYYKPGILPREKGYQTEYARPIPLTVTPRAEVRSGDLPGAPPAGLPDRVCNLAEGPAVVLRHDEPFALPGPAWLTLLMLGPPALCAGWFMVWRRRHPDPLTSARKRQSQAARKALRALRAVGRCPAAEASCRASAVVADYLRERLGAGAAEPTPAEVAAFLRRHGGDGPLADRTAGFFEACDAARFAPGPPPNGTPPAGQAAALIADLEAHPWATR